MKSVTVAVFIARFDQLSATVVVSIIPRTKTIDKVLACWDREPSRDGHPAHPAHGAAPAEPLA